MQKHIYIIGYGDVGARISPLLIERGAEVHAISRTRKVEIADPHFHYHTIDLDTPNDKLAIIKPDSDIVYLAPPPAQGTQEHRIGSFLSAIERHNTIPRRIVYISATGVYGDCRGEWITEDTPLSPNADRSKRRMDAERQIQGWCHRHKCEWIILRVAGIYGPEKLPIERLKKGMTILKQDIAPASNRIHIEDLANIVVLALDSDKANEIYNVADDQPTTMSDYFYKVAQIYNLPAPREVSWEEAQQNMSPQMLSYLSESKRISNKKLKTVLGAVLKYPNLSKGLDNTA